MYGKVVGNTIFYQVRWYSGKLLCTDSRTRSNVSSNYYNGYAECGPLPRGFPEFNVTLTMNDEIYVTNENLSTANGPYPASTTGI